MLLKFDSIDVFKFTEFKYLYWGSFFLNLGIRMTSTMLAWWIYKITHDPLYIGFIAMAEVIPAIGFAIFAGHLVDIKEKTKILKNCCKGFIFLYPCFLALILLFYHQKIYFDWAIWITLILVFISGFIRAFSGPTLQSLITYIIPKQLLPKAVSWHKGQFFSSMVFGHILIGFLIYFIDYYGALIVICCFIFLGATFLFKISPKEVNPTSNTKNMFQNIKEGIQFVFKTKEIFGVLSLDLWAVLFGGVVGILPVYASEVLKCSPIGFGWLNAATDLGAITYIFGSTLFPMSKNQGRKMLVAVGIYGLMIVIFGLSKNFMLSFIVLYFSGIADGISIITRSSIVQLFTPKEMQGRVLSVNSIFVNSSNEIGQFESGLAAKTMGVVPSVVFGGCMTMAIVLYISIKNKKIRNLSY